jgi:glycosyltransferase involved in cell wall biosynthesis
MKILYVVHQFYPDSYSGTEKFLLNVAGSIQRDGHIAQVATYTLAEQRKDFQRRQNLFVRDYCYRELPVTAVRHQRLPLDINSHCSNPDLYRFAMEYLQKKKFFDILHIAHPMRMAPFAQAAMDSGIPHIVTFTDFWSICPRITLQTASGMLCSGPEGGKACASYCREFPPDFIQNRLSQIRQILSRAKALVSPSRFLASVFKKEFPDLKINIIPHGMDLRYFKPNPRKYSQGDKITFSYCGGFSPHKGVHVLIKAFLNLNPANAELKLYGSSFHEYDYYSQLQTIAKQDARVQFCGTYEEEQVGNIMSESDVLVIPSLWYENYPLVLHEALTCNVPVISSNIGGMAEKIKDAVNGFTFQVGNEQDLTSRMKFILDNPGILNDLKERMNSYIPPRIEEEAYLYQRLYSSAKQTMCAVTVANSFYMPVTG